MPSSSLFISQKLAITHCPEKSEDTGRYFDLPYVVPFPAARAVSLGYIIISGFYRVISIFRKTPNTLILDVRVASSMNNEYFLDDVGRQELSQKLSSPTI